MEIEIYLPCRPEWICDLILIGFGLLGLALLIGFVIVLVREHLKIRAREKAISKKRKRKE